MSPEGAFIDHLRAVASHPGARGLTDDAAILDIGDEKLVLTHDILVEGVHFLASDPPEDVAWKLVAVNLSDLAAKGASPVAALVGYMLGASDWDAAFAAGLGSACTAMGVALIGGDTVSTPAGSARSFGLTAIGRAGRAVPSRSGAGPGDALFVTGTIGDAGLGLDVARRLSRDVLDPHDRALLEAYRRPAPQLDAGAALAPLVTAMMDVSDGLLIDASRLAEASGCAVVIDLEAIPLSQAAIARAGDALEARLNAATAGDDYQLLFTTSLPLPRLPCAVTRIGQMISGSGIQVQDRDGAVPLPPRLGWLHGLP